MEKKELIIFLVLFLFSSCTPSGNRNNDAEELSSVILDSQIDEMETSEGKKVYYRFPSPEDMLQYINREKLEYIPEVLNPHEYSKKYIGSDIQALNLGVYISELAYIIMFKKLNLASDYLEAVNYLSDKLLISPNDNSDVEDRVKRNLNNIDSLKVITRDAYNDMVEYLSNTQNEQTLALITMGAYVEALHLALNQINNVEPENPLIKKIFEQKYALDNLYLYLNEHGDEESQYVTGQLKTIKSKLDQIKIVKVSKTEVKQEAGMLVFEGGKTKIEITQKQFTDIKQTIAGIRKEIVGI